MVAGITVTFNAFGYFQQVRTAMAATTTQASNNAAAAQIQTAVQALDTALNALTSGPAGLGAAHRDLGRRLNDMLISDVDPTPSVIAGVDGPCRNIDTSLDVLRGIEATTLAGLNQTLARAGLAALPTWTPPAAPACQRR